MKKRMLRMLSLVLTLCILMMSGSALAEQETFTVSVGNFDIAIGEQTLSLPVTLTLHGGADIPGERGFGLVSLTAGGQEALSAAVAYEDETIKGQLSNMGYGVYITLEDLMAMAGVEGGDIASMLPEGTEEALTRMLEASKNLENISADAFDTAAMLEMMGASAEYVGDETITLFDTEAEAAHNTFSSSEVALSEYMDAMIAASPEFAEYWDAYMDYMNIIMAETGEELSVDELLGAVAMSMTGDLYEADNGMYLEMVLTVIAEEEAISIPITVTTLTDEAGTYVSMDYYPVIDGELIYMSVYTDNYAADEMDCTNVSAMFTVGDADSEEYDVAMMLEYGFGTSADEVIAYGELYSETYGEAMGLSMEYTGVPVENGQNGYLTLAVDNPEMPMAVSMETCFEIGDMPGGELLPISSDSYNLAEVNDEMLAQLESDAQVSLFQAMGVLMQTPEIAGLINSFTAVPEGGM